MTTEQYDGKISISDSLSPSWFFLTGSFLFFVSFFACNFLKRGSFNLPSGYITLLFLFYLCWLIASLIGKKFTTKSYSTYWTGILVLARSALYLTYCITFMVVVLGLVGYSRLQILSTCGMVCLLESVTWYAYYKIVNSRQTEALGKKDEKHRKKVISQVSYFLLGFDLILVLVSFFAINLIKRGDFGLLPHYDKLLLLIYGLWFLCSFTTQKFSIKMDRDVYFPLWQWLKAGILMLACTGVIVFGLRLFYFSRFQVFGSISLLITLEFFVLHFYFWVQKNNGNDNDVESVEHVKKILDQEDLSISINHETIRQKLMEPAQIKLQNRLIENYPDVLLFINKNIDINDMTRMEIGIASDNKINVPDSDRIITRLFLNLHKINDIKRMNQYFLQVHQMLLPGGYFIAHAHTIKTHKDWVYCKYPKQVANIVYFFDFCTKRIMPKLPGLKRIYFALCRGKNRIISRAEVLGRLCFCGFEIVAEKEINKRLCFIARKVKTPSLNQNPTYGPLIELNRYSSDNSIITIHKFRTMHPYSEYLQQFVYDMQGLKEGGKMHGDFRVATWGRIMRKLWLDELPMIYNWMKGDIQFVGVRPLSPHYFSLYDKELQELRKRVKPGLIPPFYADLPKDFDEICDSERRYIKAFLKHPVRTQSLYFCKAFFNIVFKGARSN